MNGFLWRSTLLLALLPGLSGAAQAQTAALVRDINTTTPWTGSMPAYDGPLLGLSGKVFFSSREPAVAEGSGASSEILADLCPGDCASVYQVIGRLQNAANPSDIVLFAALPQPGEIRLYRTDGTRAGTYSVGELSSPSLVRDGDIVLAQDRIFFIRRDLDRFPELWVSDGTAAGTRQVPFPAGSAPPVPLEMVAVGSRVFLRNLREELWTSDGTAAVLLHAAADGEAAAGLTGGRTRLYFSAVKIASATSLLWTSDGTLGGTRPVAGFPAVHGDLPLASAVGDHVYEPVDDLVHGEELWTSDGTVTGSHRVSDLAAADPFGVTLHLLGFPAPFVAELGGRVIFATRQGLFASDGTPGSTTLLTPDHEGVLSPLVRVGTRVLYLGLTSDTADTPELWSTDGTAAGTARLAMHVDQLVAVGGAAYFLADGAESPELWTSDGTPAGTRRYSDPLPTRVSLQHLEALGSQVFFLATTAPLGPVFELWTSDGRPGGTHRVPGLTASGASSFPESLTAAGDRLLFAACDGTTRLAWQSDGTAAGTVPLATLPPGLAGCSADNQGSQTGVQGITPVGQQVFFWAPDDDLSRWHLFRTDGAGNTLELATAHSPLPLVPFGGLVFFADAVTPTSTPAGVGLFRSDGTAAGTRLASEIPVSSQVFSLTTAGGVLYLSVGNGSATEVWASDGTAAGSRRLLSGPYSISFGIANRPPAFVVAGPWTYFFLSELGVGAELWRTDGTTAGTARVATVVIPLADPAALSGSLYFLGDDVDNRVLYRVDATDPAAVTVVRRFAIGPATNFLAAPTLAPFAGRLFFAADDGLHGLALWASDGTPGGTVQVATAGGGPESSGISQLTPAGDRLFFTAWDLAHGIELWESDGTAAGTRLAADIAPEGSSSSPDQLTVAGGRLFFTADDGVTGRELWSLPLGSPAGCQPGDTRLCLAAGRFKVEIAWKDFAGHAGVGHAVALTADTGYFWFFDPANVEAVVKVLDARTLNNAFWVFYGALSNVEYEITVTDTQTGLSRRYLNPSGRLASVGDTAGFGPLGAYEAVLQTPVAGLPLVSARSDARAATGACAPGPGQLCLQGGRFAVTSTWKDFQGRTGTGTAVPLSGDTGYFWFFAPTNVEVVTKVLDGTGLNGKFWFFYGALSNVEYTLTVTDTRTGAVQTYRNPSGQFGSVADTGAF